MLRCPPASGMSLGCLSRGPASFYTGWGTSSELAHANRVLLSVCCRLSWGDDLLALGPHKSSAADCYVVLDFCLYLEPQTEKTHLEAGCTV